MSGQCWVPRRRTLGSRALGEAVSAVKGSKKVTDSRAFLNFFVWTARSSTPGARTVSCIGSIHTS